MDDLGLPHRLAALSILAETCPQRSEVAEAFAERSGSMRPS
jgi:hypothetical protein